MQFDLDRIYEPSLRSWSGILSSNALMDAAEHATGLSDWGGDAWNEEGFRHRLGVLCQSLEDEAHLTPTGRSRAHSRVHMMLCSRLLVLEWRRSHMEGDPEPLTPFIGSGSGRTGTSFTHQLLAQDPENIAATEAHCMVPVPPPGDLVIDARRNSLIERFIAFQGLDASDVNDLHPFAPENPQEDSVLQEGMCGPAPMAFFNVPTFVDLVNRSEEDAYAWQRAVMQVLQSGPLGHAAKRWALKSPTHIGYMDTLMRTFPDARLYVNHRDPRKVLASHCSMFSTFFRLNSDADFDPKVIGSFLLEMHKSDLDAVSAWRAVHPDVKIVDVHFADLIKDPVSQAERIYSHFDVPLSDEAKNRMTRFLSVNRHGQGARKREVLEEFGLTERQVDEAFGSYMDRYAVIPGV